MAESDKKTLATLREFMNQIDRFINIEDTLQALTVTRKIELDQADMKAKMSAQSKTTYKAKGEHCDKGQDNSRPTKGTGARHDRVALTIQEKNRPVTQDISHWDGGRSYSTYHHFETHNTTECNSFERQRGRVVYSAPLYLVDRRDEWEQSEGGSLGQGEGRAQRDG